jgi:hypothetical protein
MLEDVRYNEGLSRWCVVQYVTHYGKRYTRITGKPLNMEVAARIHNGGPNGWKESRKPYTDAHWRRFESKRKELFKCQKK